MGRKKKVLCPKCKGKLLDIVYGMPGPELFDKAEKGEVYLGGCCIWEKNPKYFCPKCHIEYFEDLTTLDDEKEERKMRKPIANYDGEDLYLLKSSYANNGRIYLALEYYDTEAKDYELWGDITVNISDFVIENDNIVFIDHNLFDEVYEQLVKVGLLKEIEIMKYNLARFKKCQLNMNIVDEYLKEN